MSDTLLEPGLTNNNKPKCVLKLLKNSIKKYKIQGTLVYNINYLSFTDLLHLILIFHHFYMFRSHGEAQN